MSDIYESPDRETLEQLRNDAEKRAAREAIEAARKALGREPSEQDSAELVVARILKTLIECFGVRPVVVGEDGRIGRLELAGHETRPDVCVVDDKAPIIIPTRREYDPPRGSHWKPVYRVCWETE